MAERNAAAWAAPSCCKRHSLDGGSFIHQIIKGQGHEWNSVPFRCSVVLDSLWLHRLQHTRLPCPSPSPQTLRFLSIELVTPSNHLIPFSSHRQSFPASGSFPVSQFFTLSVQSIGASTSASVLPTNIQDGLSLGWTGLLDVYGTLKSLLQHHSSKASILQCSAFFIVQLSRPYMTTGKTIPLTRRTFGGNVSAF